MPWKERNKMEERVRFVARLLDGEKMAPLCRSLGISRTTGCKIFQRYKEMGLEGLTDRSRGPYRQAKRLPFQIEQLIVSLKKDQPTWGAPKIREKLKRLYPDVHARPMRLVQRALGLREFGHHRIGRHSVANQAATGGTPSRRFRRSWGT